MTDTRKVPVARVMSESLKAHVRSLLISARTLASYRTDLTVEVSQVMDDKLLSEPTRWYLRKAGLKADLGLVGRMYLTWLESDLLNTSRSYLFFLYIAVWVHIALLDKFEHPELASNAANYARELVFALTVHIDGYSVREVVGLFKRVAFE